MRPCASTSASYELDPSRMEAQPAFRPPHSISQRWHRRTEGMTRRHQSYAPLEEVGRRSVPYAGISRMDCTWKMCSFQLASRSAQPLTAAAHRLHTQRAARSWAHMPRSRAAYASRISASRSSSPSTARIAAMRVPRRVRIRPPRCACPSRPPPSAPSLCSYKWVV